MSDLLYEKMGLAGKDAHPGGDASYLGKRVFKKLFHEHADLTVTDKKAFTDDVDTIIWQYTLKPSTIRVPAYEDDQREYHEIAVLQVDLKTQQRTQRVAEVIHRAVPYPIVLVLMHATGEASVGCGPSAILSVAHKRFSQAEKGAIVIEESRDSGWLDLSDLDAQQQAFLDALRLQELPSTHLYALYSALVDRVVALNAARRSGVFSLRSSTEQREERRRLLAECRTLESRIAELRAALKKEKQFNRQVELNTRISQLAAQLEQYTQRL